MKARAVRFTPEAAAQAEAADSWWRQNRPGSGDLFANASHTGVIRLPDVPARTRITLMSDVLTRFAADLEGGAIVTVRGSRIRVSRRVT